MVKFKWQYPIGQLKVLAKLTTERYIKQLQSIVQSFIRATFFCVAGRSTATARDCSIEAQNFTERFPSKEAVIVVSVENYLTNMVQSVCSDVHDGTTQSEAGSLEKIAPILKSIIVTRSKDGATVDEIIGNPFF